MPTENEEFYYNATAYVGVRQKDTISLSWLGPNFSNSINRKELSKRYQTNLFSEPLSPKTQLSNFHRNITLTTFVFGQVTNGKELKKTKIKKKEFEEENKTPGKCL